MTPHAKVVLDASAVLAWLFKERGADTVDVLLGHAVIPASALTESLYRSVERGHALPPSELATALAVMGCHVEPVVAVDSVRAAELIAGSRSDQHALGSLSLGDGLCLAVAERVGLPVTGGEEYWQSLDLRVPYLPFR